MTPQRGPFEACNRNSDKSPVPAASHNVFSAEKPIVPTVAPAHIVDHK